MHNGYAGKLIHNRTPELELKEEQQARIFLSEYAYAKAAKELRKAMALDPSLNTRIESEFGFLFRLIEADESRTADAMGWITRLWRIAAAGNSGILPPLQLLTAPEIGQKENDIALPQTDAAAPLTTSEQALEDLEPAILRLFQQVFTLSPTDQQKLSASLHGLASETLPGWEVAFEAVRKDLTTVRCHVECTDHSGPLRLQDFAVKWLQARREKLDHWILISVRAEPEEELLEFLQDERGRSMHGFTIQVWSPANGVAELFGLEPEVFDRLFQPSPPEPHPRQWDGEKREQVAGHFRERLTRRSNLPPSWEEYLNRPEWLCLPGNECREFEIAYPNRVGLTLLTEEGTELAGTAEQCLIRDWLEVPSSPRCCFILGDFGDGKSFLTYTLSRALTSRFRSAPESAYLPLRLALREYAEASNPREFLQARLERFGSDTKEWEAIKRGEQWILVILDGFDEISKELDPETVTRNIKDLLDCCGAAVFNDCKLLITSRNHFFESRDAKRLLTRLGNPLVYRLAGIPRGRVREGLKQSLAADEQHSLLSRLETMHDPIGLASKPLFFQMVRETLHELPDDLDEVVIYQGYVRRALERKLELLADDPGLRTGDRQENLQRTLNALGLLAVELQCSTTPYVSLKQLAEESGMAFAELLWKLTGSDEAESNIVQPESNSTETIRQGLEKRLSDLAEEHQAIITDLGSALSNRSRLNLGRERQQVEQELHSINRQLAELTKTNPPLTPLEQDAMARVGARTLLARVDTEDEGGQWRVDFCHRSVREYFVARRLVEVLDSEPDAVVAFFEKVPVNYEILFFAGLILRRGDQQRGVDKLLGVLERSRLGYDQKGFGGSVLTLLASVSPKLPANFDYTGRNYALADLQDADLSDIDFSDSSFQRAKFSNVKLNGAKLCRCDLDGVRLDETTAVQAIALSAWRERILGVYEDGSVWEWDVSTGGRPDYRILFTEPGLRLSRFGLGPGKVAWGSTGRELLLFDADGESWHCMAKIPLALSCADFSVEGNTLVALGLETASQCRVINLEGMKISIQTTLPETSVFAAAGKDMLVYRVNDAKLRLLALGDYSQFACEIPCRAASSVAIWLTSDDRVLVACGQADGQLRVLQIHAGDSGGLPVEVFSASAHRGRVASLLFMGDDALVSGGTDRGIAITRIPSEAGNPPPISKLERSLPCAGLCIDGLRPEEQRLRLARLIESSH